MKYDIYFHHDFDGAASAAIILEFLERRGDSVARLIPLDFSARRMFKERWHATRFPRPAAVLDFLYHPKAAFWFDHHPTTFLREEWRKNFKSTKFCRFDPKYLSCCSLVLDALVRDFKFRPPKHFRELARWGDMIDSAGYRSARQWVELKEPASKISAYIDSLRGAPDEIASVVHLFRAMPLAAMLRLPKIRAALRHILAKQRRILAFYRENLAVTDNVAFIDLASTTFGRLSAAPYYLRPKILYSVSTTRKSKEIFHLNVAANPWRKDRNKIHIGKFLGRYSGGGHRGVGGAEFTSADAARKAAREVIEYLRNASKTALRR